MQKMITRNQVVVMLAIAGLIATTVAMTTMPAYAKHHGDLKITIHGHGEVTVHGSGHAPHHVKLDCEPGSGFGWSVTARC
jgi:hypothetical protein